MPNPRRINKVNSLLREVIADVIVKEVKHPDLPGKILTVTSVDVTKDLMQGTVYVSVLGDESDKAIVLAALTSAAGFIAVTASKKVALPFFPELTFKIDDTAEKHLHIEKLLSDIEAERMFREENNDTDSHGTDE